MAAILEDVKVAASSLTPAEQIELVDFLEISSFDEDGAIRGEWSELAQKRLTEHESGVRQAVPFNRVFKRLKVD